jgi:hypothetical protein
MWALDVHGDDVRHPRDQRDWIATVSRDLKYVLVGPRLEWRLKMG